MSTVNNSTLERYVTFPENLKISDKYDVLVLSGGGLKGIIHLGMLYYIGYKESENRSENNEDHILDSLLRDPSLSHIPLSINKNSPIFSINSFVGTSIGAVICFLLIIGLSPVEILSHICSKDYSSSSKIDLSTVISKCGLTSFDSFFDEISKTTENKIGFIPTMSELYENFNKDFVCVTHNMTLDETVYIDHISHPNLSCIEALKMSCNVPLLFEKYMYDKCFYIDGAVSDNFPIEYASNRYPNKKILGLYVEKVLPTIRENKDDDFLSYIKVLLTLSFRMNCKKSKNFKSHNTDIINVTINDSFTEWKFESINSSTRLSLFSIGYKIIDDISSKIVKENGDKIKSD